MSGWRAPPGRPNRDSGSTTFEALAAVLLLSVAGTAALGAAWAGIRAFRTGRPAAATSVRALAFDDALREAAREIRIPYWERGARSESFSGGLRIGYRLGIKDDFLALSVSGRGLSLANSGGARQFEGIELLAVSPAPDSESPPRGLLVEYRIEGRSFRALAEFGSWALAEDGP